MAFDNHCKIIGYETALPLIEEWLNSDYANVRRAVSEGLRIWTSRPYFKDNPQIAVQLLSAHKQDNSEYVRKSTPFSEKCSHCSFLKWGGCLFISQILVYIHTFLNFSSNLSNCI